MGERINSYKELHVYENAMNAAMEIFELTKEFPIEEKYSMVDQIRFCSRSECADLSEAWRKRRYKAAFVSRLSDSETEREKFGSGSNLLLDASTSTKPWIKGLSRLMTR